MNVFTQSPAKLLSQESIVRDLHTHQTGCTRSVSRWTEMLALRTNALNGDKADYARRYKTRMHQFINGSSTVRDRYVHHIEDRVLDVIAAKDHLAGHEWDVIRVTKDLAVESQKLAMMKAITTAGGVEWELTESLRKIKNMEFIWDADISVEDDGFALDLYFKPYVMQVWGATYDEDDEPSIEYLEEVAFQELDPEDFREHDDDEPDEQQMWDTAYETAQERLDEWQSANSIDVDECVDEIDMPHVHIRVLVNKDVAGHRLHAVTHAQSTDYIHPHWINADDPCLGRAGPLIREAAKYGDLVTLVTVLYSYLTACDGTDSAGKEWKRYEDMVIVDEEYLTRDLYEEIGHSGDVFYSEKGVYEDD